MHQIKKAENQAWLLLVICAVVLLGMVQAGAAEVLKRPNWDRETALLAASKADTQPETDRLFQLMQNRAENKGLEALVQFAARSDWSAPAREAVLYQLTNRIRDLPPFSVDENAMAFLRNYQSQTLVSHEESSSHGVPLYPIAAAAHGVKHHWVRQQTRVDVSELLNTGASVDLVGMYLQNDDYNTRAGMRDALKTASPTTLRSILNNSLPRIEERPELTGLSGEAALQLVDSRALSQVMIQGKGHELTELTRQAKQRIPEKGLALILLAGLDSAPASTSAMLIAELAPQTLSQARVSEALMMKLDDRDLGSTAALALVTWGTEQQREALSERLAIDSSSPAARRIQTAMTAVQSDQSRN